MDGATEPTYLTDPLNLQQAECQGRYNSRPANSTLDRRQQATCQGRRSGRPTNSTPWLLATGDVSGLVQWSIDEQYPLAVGDKRHVRAGATADQCTTSLTTGS
ncbi:hypothetical protein BHM03_00062540 [Ensete ventricosum]|nr:hypothetical protein BHM03_00062540 [Ensete ventricosum]